MESITKTLNINGEEKKDSFQGKKAPIRCETATRKKRSTGKTTMTNSAPIGGKMCIL